MAEFEVIERSILDAVDALVSGERVLIFQRGLYMGLCRSGEEWNRILDLELQGRKDVSWQVVGREYEEGEA